MSAERLAIAMIGPGSSPHVFRLAEGLAGRGHRLDVISEDRYAPFPAVPGVAFHAYPSAKGFAGRARAVRDLLERLAPDVVHSHFVNHGGYMAVASGFHPHVMTAWGSDILLAPRRSPRRRLETALGLRSADWVLSDAEELRRNITRLAGPLRHNDIQLWGVDMGHFSPSADGRRFRDRLGVGDAPIVLSSRALEPLYNQDALVAAWPAVKRAVPGAILVIVRYLAEPNYEAQVRAQADRLGVAESIRWVETLAFDELPSAYAAADVVVSIPSSDSTPITVLEALACGSRIVACDLPALREWITPPANGYLVNPRDEARIAEAVVAWLEAPEDAVRRVREESPRLVAERADRRVWMDRLEVIYQRLATDKRFSHWRTLRNVAGL